ncbi:MAG TPA: cysteine rich repeat-containing protein [Candidatus Binatia bacterium]|nr:cysteine rich repeat-containing protein [Candidatus Binatia bacterium]
MSIRGLILTAMVAMSASAAFAQGGPMRGAKAEEAKMVLGACKPDIARFCGQVPPGEGRVKACMKQHMHELSEPCKEALFQAWLHD